MLIALAVFALGTVEARESDPHRSNGNNGSNGQAKAADCSPSTAITELALNNVRLTVETGGNMWQDRATNSPRYEVPKTIDRSGANAIFAGALWMGGVSPDNQLKLAAVRFRADGNDYWPGPLTNTGDASVTPDVCEEYDRTWRTFRSDAQLHEAYFNCLADPDCDDSEEFPGYVIPPVFFDWPAHGEPGLNQDFYLAPFTDYNEDGLYEPTDGDYPGYDLDGVVDCRNRFREDPVPLFGDENVWWVFNDKGNVHTETGGDPIGMEARAQAFAFSTNDEVNNMTFYNYVLINQGTQRLTDTYFGQWVDMDLGNSQDDYVGCDVERGLGYGYNGDNNDEDGTHTGYGVQPPAVGIDFFEGPFADEDGIDNPLTDNTNAALDSNGIVYKGIGIGYGDGVVDNERYGMRAFLYHNNDLGFTGDPGTAIEYYNYMKGIWKDNSPMFYGGDGHINGGGDPNLRSFYMFPGDSDPLDWGTLGVDPGPEWTEESAGNFADDRRFLQSAGPFTLDPGEYNNITVGVVWARATGGGPFQSVEAVRTADDKAQALFDNCFRILDGPDSPDLSFQELDRELILYIKNSEASNNFNEMYEELDPTIPEEVTLPDTSILFPDRFYRFQGYQIFQLKNSEVSVSDLDNIDLARPLFQTDVEDGITQIINYINDPQIGLPVPTEMVDGADEGIAHSFKITEDLFATGANPRLVNHKTYYYMALAYGYNNWQDYNADALTGQPFQYKAGRKAATGSIRAYTAVPHIPSPENGGTVQSSEYGDGFQITRLEGQGNGNLILDLTDETITAIVDDPDWRQDELTYKKGMGPIDVKVVDPLNVPNDQFEIWFQDSLTGGDDLDEAYWFIVRTSTSDTVYADRAITIGTEQIITEWGISVNVGQHFYSGDGNKFTEALDAVMEYDDPTKAWLGGISDQEGFNVFNWIRSGTTITEDADDPNSVWNDYPGKDDEELYEGLLEGTWTVWPVVGDTAFQPADPDVFNTVNLARINQSSSVAVVFTSDKSRWSRVPVFEMQLNPNLSEYGDDKMTMRSAPSVDKDGRSAGDSGYNAAEGDLVSSTSMGWFPGYAVNLETGERLNMAFGEDSWLAGENGRDMLWNPSERLSTDLGAPLFGGQHWIYVFKNERMQTGSSTRMPQYDQGQYTYDFLSSGSGGNVTKVFRAVNWVGSSILLPGRELLETDVKVRLSIAKPYEAYKEPYGGYLPTITTDQNGGLPLYRFDTEGNETLITQATVAESALDIINVVPNPYFAYSAYEQNRIDTRVKFTNLPQICTITIFNASGTLVRQYRKDDPTTSLDWDLKNSSNVPIAGGTYICHVEVPGVGETIVKWFGALRPVDLENF